jgi:hypothetical protein
MTLRKKLAAFFLPTRTPLGTEGAVVAKSMGHLFRRHEWVVARNDCQYRQQDFSQLPARQRSSAARLAAKHHAPAAGMLTCIAWTGAVAHLWMWLPGDDVSRADIRWIPETLLLPPPGQDAVRLLQQARGVEGQVWRGGMLVASQSWSEAPHLETWRRFVRSAGGDVVADEVPSLQELPWLLKPWARLQREGGILRERLAWSVLMALVAATLGWQLASLLHWQSAAKTMAMELDGNRAKAGPVLAARDSAEAATVRIDELTALQAGINDYSLMAEIITALPEGSQFTGWSRDPSKLRVAVKSEQTDPRLFVSAFSKQPKLGAVTATPGLNGLMVLEFILTDGDQDVDSMGEL